LRKLAKSERVECISALCELSESFGQPYLHSGLGIRKLGSKLFECRGGTRYVLSSRTGQPIFSFHSWATTMKSKLCSDAAGIAEMTRSQSLGRVESRPDRSCGTDHWG